MGVRSMAARWRDSLLVILACSGWIASGAQAAMPRVHFDVVPFVGAEEVGDASFALRNPEERLVNVALSASALVSRGDVADVGEIVFHFYAVDAVSAVHDYSPDTTLGSDVVGNVEVTTSDQTSGSRQLSLGARYQDVVEGSIGGAREKVQSESLHFARRPVQEVVMASGRIARGRGVYFKLHATSQTSLEGSHRFVLQLRVPRTWRGSCLRAICTARTVKGARCGQSSWLVPVYAQGDLEAKEAANRLNQTESALIQLAVSQRDAIARASRPTLMHELSLVDKKIPDDWLARLLSQPATGQKAGFESRLPVPVRLAAAEFREARRAMAALNHQAAPQDAG